MYGIRIILADPDPLFRKYIKEKLLKAGYMVVGEASDGRKALQVIFNIQPDLVIVNADLPGKSGLEVAETVEGHRLAPVIIITEPDLQDDLKEVLEHLMVSYILKPVDEINLIPSVEVCVAMFRKFRRLEEENRKLKQTLETRKVIEKAKGLLIEFKGMTEPQAFKYMQKLSMDNSQPVQKIAKQIITTMERK
ncbi:MAG: ANTAR domain-containing response regulator [Eubacteriales bacterium]